MNSTSAEIRDLEDRITQAERVADPDFFDRIIAPGFSFIAQDGSVVTKEKVLEAHRPAGSRKFTRYEAGDPAVADFGDAAVATVRVELSAVSGQQVTLQFTRFWHKRDDQWQIVGGAVVQLAHSH